MAKQDYYSGLISDFWTSFRQKQATGGRPLTRSETSGLVNPMLNHNYQLSLAAADRAEQIRQFNERTDLAREQMNREKEAAQAQGLVNVGGLYGQYKVGMATADALKGAAGGGVQTAGAAGESLLTAGAGTLTKPAELSGSLVTPTESALAASPTTFPVSEDLLAAGAGEGATEGLAAGASAALGPAAIAGGITSMLLGRQSEAVQAGGAALVGGIAGYIAAGSAVGGPAGFILGAAIGGVTSLADDVSVVCTELKRQGLLDTRLHRAASLYTMRMADDAMYWMYLEHGNRLVPLMRKSKLFTYLMVPFGRALAKEAAHRYDPERFPKGSILACLYEMYLARKARRILRDWEASHATR